VVDVGIDADTSGIAQLGNLAVELAVETFRPSNLVYRHGKSLANTMTVYRFSAQE
jgi:hypothetical protein